MPCSFGHEVDSHSARCAGRELIQPTGALASGRASSACSARGFGARKGSATDLRGSQTRRADPSSPVRHGGSLFQVLSSGQADPLSEAVPLPLLSLLPPGLTVQMKLSKGQRKDKQRIQAKKH
ncbi:hypothetical protein AB1E18_005115 [Capra hircus]